jgi:hypothetical protein
MEPGFVIATIYSISESLFFHLKRLLSTTVADPLSIASGIAGLLSLGIQVTQSLDTGPEVVEICPEL